MLRYTKLTWLREIGLWGVAILFLLPFYFLIATALKPDSEVYGGSPFAFPATPAFENFLTLFAGDGQSNVVHGLVNSVLITGGSILGLVLLGSLTGYVIARSTKRWGRVVFYLFLIAIILPVQLGAVPLYIGARSVGLTGSALGMVVLYTGMMLPLAIFLYAGFFRSLGTEYEEAAAIDGATPTQIFFQVVLPLPRLRER